MSDEMDLDAIECRRRRRYSRRERAPGQAQSNAAFALSALELACWVVRTELLRRARGTVGVLDGRGSIAMVAHQRCRETGLRRWRDGEVETGLVWLCARGLCEGLRAEQEVTPYRPMRQVYRWTVNATDERLRLVITGVR